MNNKDNKDSKDGRSPAGISFAARQAPLLARFFLPRSPRALAWVSKQDPSNIECEHCFLITGAMLSFLVTSFTIIVRMPPSPR